MRNSRLLKIIALILVLTLIISVFLPLNSSPLVPHVSAEIPSGSKDYTFDTGEGVGFNGGLNTTAVQSDGRVIVGGWFSSHNGISRNHIARLNVDGSLDTSFNVGTGFDGGVLNTVVQSDGKIIVGGSFSNYNNTSSNQIARLNVDGSLDTSFNIGTGFNSPVRTISIQSDGKIIVGGDFTSYNGSSIRNIARLNNDGSIDPTFIVGNSLNSPVYTATLQNDSKIIIGGAFTSYNGTSRSQIARLNPDGSLDTSFIVGTGLNGNVYTASLQSDGKVIIGGWFTSFNGTSRNQIARLNLDGSLDTSFIVGSGFNGEIVNASIIQGDGKIILGGYFASYNGVSSNRLIRLNSDGSIDSSYNLGVGFDSPITTISSAGDGGIIVGGGFSSYNGTPKHLIAKLNTGGDLENNFNIATGFNSGVSMARIQSDGKVIVGGGFNSYNGISRNRLTRLNIDGSLDTSFVVGEGFDSDFYTISNQSDGKVIVGGEFSSYNGISSNRIVRINADGSFDTSFGTGTGFDGAIYTISIQNDGKLLVGGEFSSYNGVSRNNIARLNSDGSLDLSFVVGTGFDGSLNTSKFQSDGKVIVGGGFTSYNGVTRNYLARLNSDGSLDTSFDMGVGFDQAVSAISPQNDGKIIVGGWFSTFSGVSRNYLARLNSDGSLDTSFNVGTGFDGGVTQIVIQNNGEIITGGGFHSYDGTSRNYIARLNPDGSLETSFNVGTGFDSDVSTITLNSNGNILVGGYFNSYNGNSSPYLISLIGTTLYQIDNPDSTLDFVSLSLGDSIRLGTSSGENNSEASILLQKDSNPIALINVDLGSGDQNWEGISANIDLDAGMSFFHYDDSTTTNECSPNCEFSDIPGVLGTTYNLYVPKISGHTGVYICPGASNLAEVSTACLGGMYIKSGETGVIGGNVVTITSTSVEGQDYWIASGVSGTGGVSVQQNDPVSEQNSQQLAQTGSRLILTCSLCVLFALIATRYLILSSINNVVESRK